MLSEFADGTGDITDPDTVHGANTQQQLFTSLRQAVLAATPNLIDWLDTSHA